MPADRARGGQGQHGQRQADAAAGHVAAPPADQHGGGVALRFARVLRYRPDKTPGEADTIDTVRSLLRE